jgi:hypothetical protein
MGADFGLMVGAIGFTSLGLVLLAVAGGLAAVHFINKASALILYFIDVRRESNEAWEEFNERSKR